MNVLDIEKILKEKNLRLTQQRKDIFKEILKTEGHFEIEELVYKLKEKGINASRATVYRTLHLLKDLGLINEVIKRANKTFYEVNLKEHHDHLICLSCGKIIEFHDDKIEKIQNKICKKFKFKPSYHRLEIFGICEECQKKGE
jgi:Fur family ferric uptake transcriptional regulator